MVIAFYLIGFLLWGSPDLKAGPALRRSGIIARCFNAMATTVTRNDGLIGHGLLPFPL